MRQPVFGLQPLSAASSRPTKTSLAPFLDRPLIEHSSRSAGTEFSRRSNTTAVASSPELSESSVSTSSSGELPSLSAPTPLDAAPLPAPRPPRPPPRPRPRPLPRPSPRGCWGSRGVGECVDMNIGCITLTHFMSLNFPGCSHCSIYHYFSTYAIVCNLFDEPLTGENTTRTEGRLCNLVAHLFRVRPA